MTTVQAYRKPIVGVLSTGSELVDCSSSGISAGKIRDSNRPMLLAMLREADVHVVDLGICVDHREQLATTVTDALHKVDVLLTSGGVSMVCCILQHNRPALMLSYTT